MLSFELVCLGHESPEIQGMKRPYQRNAATGAFAEYVNGTVGVTR